MIRSILHTARARWALLGLSALFFLFTFLPTGFGSRQATLTREVRKAERYLAEGQEDFRRLLADTGLLTRLANGTENDRERKLLLSRTYGIFLYRLSETGTSPLMLFWNNQLATPVLRGDPYTDTLWMEKLPNGWYFSEQRMVRAPAGDLLCVALVPVQSRFFIETDYLPETFFFSRTANQKVQISSQPSGMPVRERGGRTVFYLERRSVEVATPDPMLTLIFRFAGLILLLIFIHRSSLKRVDLQGPRRAILWLGLVLFLLRLLTYFFPQWLQLRQFGLFSPLVYGSSQVLRSLGDLILNAGLFCWWVLFAWWKGKERLFCFPDNSPRSRWPAAVFFLVLLIASTFAGAQITRSLVSDSKISFDVSDFFSLSLFSVAGFFALTLVSVSYHYFTRLLFGGIQCALGSNRYILYGAVAAAGLFYLTILPQRSQVMFYLPVLAWLLLYTWLVNERMPLLQRRLSLAGKLGWIFFFSLSVSMLMLEQNSRVERNKRKSIAEKLAIQTDPSSEMLMSIAVKYLDAPFLTANFHRFYDEAKGRFLRDSIIAGNYSGFLNKYDTRIYVYDSAGASLFNDEPVTYEALAIIYGTQARPTGTEGLAYFETAFDKFNYLLRKEVWDENRRFAGTLFIVSNLKTFSRDAIFPELFRKNKRVEPENSPAYSTAVYSRGRLISPPGNYPFPTSLGDRDLPMEEFSERVSGDYSELWYKASRDKLVVVARKKQTSLEAITLFSYLFCAFLVLYALLQFLSFLTRSGWDSTAWKKRWQLSIRSQVHLTILFISLFSFLVIGVATISFFIGRNQQNNTDKLSRTMKIMVNEVEKKIADHNSFDDVVKVYDTISGSGLQQLVEEISEIHGVDVNVYDLSGNLQVSSEANVYNKGVISKKMNPGAFYHLNRLRQVLYVQEETVGAFTYFSIYAPVRDEKGEVQVYLNIPYFTSRPELRKEISNFLVTIINLNAFIFLVAGLISLLITNRITGSFTVISEKMKRVSLGAANQTIEWNRDDELGILVKEYNKMVQQLGESAALLAKSEREGAWREMARQVAHEIKNPLTPMKLGMQYLQKAIDSNQPNVKELTSQVATTIVEQIDHLSRIAADFSQFANIGNTYPEALDLHEVIQSLIDLFGAGNRAEITWFPLLEKTVVYADKTQMNRLLTNLLTNALQACPPDRRCQIRIDESRLDEGVIISIRDNGDGIPADMQSRIFTPNFTTKSSGTGLGLAMCKGIVEQARGRIWFETKAGEGSCFFVWLPELR